MSLLLLLVGGRGVETTFCDYDYAADTYDNAADSYDCGALVSEVGGLPILRVPTRRLPESTDDDDLVVMVAVLRHRIRL